MLVAQGTVAPIKLDTCLHCILFLTGEVDDVVCVKCTQSLSLTLFVARFCIQPLHAFGNACAYDYVLDLLHIEL